MYLKLGYWKDLIIHDQIRLLFVINWHVKLAYKDWFSSLSFQPCMKFAKHVLAMYAYVTIGGNSTFNSTSVDVYVRQKITARQKVETKKPFYPSSIPVIFIQQKQCSTGTTRRNRTWGGAMTYPFPADNFKRDISYICYKYSFFYSLNLSAGKGFWTNLRKNDPSTHKLAIQHQRSLRRLIELELVLAFLCKCKNANVYP